VRLAQTLPKVEEEDGKRERREKKDFLAPPNRILLGNKCAPAMTSWGSSPHLLVYVE